MKRALFPLICVLLTCSLVFGIFGSAQAAPAPGNPVVTPVSGDKEFSTKVIPLEKMPGSFVSASGLTLPVGFGEGERQFNGNGVEVTGLEGGTASVCFSFPTYRSGWNGNVYQLVEGKWISLPTTITEGAEGGPVTACANIYGDGVYALIVGYKTPVQTIHECTDILFIYPDFEEDDFLNRLYIVGGYVYPALPEGTFVRYQVINITPPGSLTGSLTGAGAVTENFVVDPSFDPPLQISYVTFPEGLYVDYAENYGEIRFTVRFYTQGCYKNFVYPDDLMGFD